VPTIAARGLVASFAAATLAALAIQGVAFAALRRVARTPPLRGNRLPEPPAIADDDPSDFPRL
jgi:hypothetical protein